MKILTIILILFMATSAFCDEIQIPFSAYTKKLQDKFAKEGLKLDLSANDRDENSWGFIESQGSRYSIFTYNQVSEQDLKTIRKIVMEK